ncbi:MAG: DUF47 domain-containing protein [Halobacteriaceae archaeon]
MTSADTAFGDRIVSETVTYLAEVEACVGELPGLCSAYAEDGAYRAAADRVAERESACDRANRQIGGLVANASAREVGIRLTRVHLNAGETIELYQRLDAVANAAERFASDLVATSPPRSAACLVTLRALADRAAETVQMLVHVVDEFVRALVDADRTASLATEVAAVRTAESECDRLRDAVVATAFDDGPTPAALCYRDLAAGLDETVDAMEDVTDQLLLLTGNQPWIDLEPDSPGDGDDAGTAPSGGRRTAAASRNGRRRPGDTGSGHGG